MSDEGVIIDVRGGVGVVRLNRPRTRNALDEALVDALAAAFDELEAQRDVRSIVLTGEGRAFCAGAVLETLLAAADGGFASVTHVYEGFLRVMRSPLPTIAAVNGPAVGAGLNLALACDVRIASSSARFDSRFPELRLHQGGGHSWLLQRAVGRQHATLMTVFGRVLDAADALEVGLVAHVCEADDLVGTAIGWGQRVADIERPLLMAMVDSLRRAERTAEHEAILALETERQRWSTTRPDFVDRTRDLQQRISQRPDAASAVSQSGTASA